MRSKRSTVLMSFSHGVRENHALASKTFSSRVSKRLRPLGLIAVSSQDPMLGRNQNAVSGFHERSIVQRFRLEPKNREFLVIATRLPVAFIADGSIR